MEQQESGVILAHQEIIDQKVCLKQLGILYHSSVRGFIGTGVSATFLLLSLREVIFAPMLIGWYVTVLLVIASRALLTRAYYRAKPKFEDVTLWRNRFITGSVCTGFLWGLAGVLLFPLDNPPYQLLTGFVIIAMTATAIVYLSIIPIVYISYMLLSILPLSISMACLTFCWELSVLST